MSGYFGFHFARKESSPEASIRSVVLFCSYAGPLAADITAQARDLIGACPTADRMIFIGFDFNAAALSECAKSEDLHDQLPPSLKGVGKIPVQCLYFSASGKLVDGETQAEIDKEAGEELRLRGFETLCQKREGVLKASDAYHYVKPSGRHCDTFVRTAELLITGGEIDWTAAWLLRFISERLEFIHCDSASILAVAYAVARLRSTLLKKDESPEILSFGSFAGLDEHKFPASDDGLYLISASSAGELARRMVLRGAVPSRIVTLLYLNSKATIGNVLFDLTRKVSEEAGGFGYEAVREFPEEDCPFCRRGSACIYMRGEHFWPHHLNVDALTIAAADAPAWLRRFLKEAVGRNVLRSHFGTAKRGEPHEIYCDVTGLLESEPFIGSLEKVLKQVLPASLKRIIHLDDPCSSQIAAKAEALFSAATGRNAPLLGANSIREDSAAYVETEGTTVVVASCLVSGRALMELSQILRSIQTNGSIVFVVGVTRASSARDLREIKSNITHTPIFAQRFGFHRIEEIFPPDYSSHRRSIWSNESDFLKRLQQKFLDAPPAFHNIVAARLEVLRAAEGKSVGGMRDELFWASPAGQELRLRPNFAFFPFFHDPTKVTQSEVYFTIASVLHSLRHSEGTRTLQQHEYHRILIHPHTFYRLNDGVVQSALLRSGLPAEFNYTISPELSSEMAEVLRFIFSEIRTERGEACIEFALALGMGQMRLCKADRDRIADFLIHQATPNSFESYLGQFLQSEIDTI